MKIFILFFVIFFFDSSNGQHVSASTAFKSFPPSTSELTKINRKNDFIFLNTIDGKLYAVGKHDGKIKWFLEEEAVLKFPTSYENPYFLTDPRDGSLYVFTGQKDSRLKKFPYTIAELVSASPSKSADGFLYTGDKKDQWLAIDYRNGHKLDTLTAETLSSKISISDENIVLIGRTQYTISMFDINTRKKVFNLTYYDYSTHSAKPIENSKPSKQNANINSNRKNIPSDNDLKIYPYYHFSSSSDGMLVTLDKIYGRLIWKIKLENPIVSMYYYENEQLIKINFAIYGSEALNDLSKEPHKYRLLHRQQKYEEEAISLYKNELNKSAKTNLKTNDDVFLSTLYIGFYKENLYALPSLVYNSDVLLIDEQNDLSNNEEHNNHQIIPFPFKNNILMEQPTQNQFEVNEIDIDKNATSINFNQNQATGNEIDHPNTIIGHHKLPEKFEPPPDYIQSNNKLIVITNKANNKENIASLHDLFSGNFKQQPFCSVDDLKKNSLDISNKPFLTSSQRFWKKFDELMQNKYIWSIFTVFVASLFPLIKTIHDYRKKKARLLLRQLNIQQKEKRKYSEEILTQSSDEEDIEVYLESKKKSSNSSQRSNSKKNNSNQNSKLEMNFNLDESQNNKTILEKNSSDKKKSFPLHASYSLPEIDSDGLVKIGKIAYDPKQVLGYGCAGTFVYKGTFEKRPVAVKRLLPECYTLADREVELLRDADQHQNVLRYFCTEADSQFRYIALELCQMTLHEYVHNFNDQNQSNNNIDQSNKQELLRPLSILEQATKGLDHLHSLDIVHRDIKPQNVLISFPDQKGKIYVMISDFGLCKRLEMGNHSFSKRSGITGTDGWIAAELIDDYLYPNNDDSSEMQTKSPLDENFQKNLTKRVTKTIDIFSLGCVYYYVLSGGSHPFGDSIRRQANILNNEYKLDKLNSKIFSENYMQRLIIEKMISIDPKIRPLTKELLAHPIYWSKAKTLQFLQDVSDRIEKIEPDDILLIELERNANIAIKNNWKTHICNQLQNDLKKFRSYNGVSVRDLLRAIRNKKHHYRELPDEVKFSLGSLPDQFIDYFTQRFPKLILHVYEAMKHCKDEPMLDVYYKYKEHFF